MEKIATDIYTFENLRKDGYVYVDKTDLLWRLVASQEGRQFFISRPRRFGKSLMLSTLKCIFEGKRELFKGLKIEKKRYDWKKYPVVMLDMSKVKGETPDELKAVLLGMVLRLARSFQVKLAKSDIVTAASAFAAFLDGLAAAKGEFVVLVDEYDVPLQGFFGDRKALLRVRQIMHDFYLGLKNHEENFRFLMLTGVTKDELILPNHLTDLNLLSKYDRLLDDFLTREERQRFDERLVIAMRRALGVGDTDSIVRLAARLQDYSTPTNIQLVTASLVQYFNKLPFSFSLTTDDSARRHFRLFMEMLGAKVSAEEGSARGYADAIIESKDFVWVFEFKFNKSTKAAIRQIREKGYADAYKGGKRPVTLVGINFRAAKRNIDEPMFEKMRGK